MGPKSRSGGVRWGYLRPVQFLDHLTVIIKGMAQCQMCYEHRVALGECCVVQEHYVLCAWLCVVNTVCSAGADAHLLSGCQCSGQQLFTFPVEQI